MRLLFRRQVVAAVLAASAAAWGWQLRAQADLEATPPSSPMSSPGYVLGSLPTLPGELRHGRELLTTKHFQQARQVFADYLQTHPGTVQAELGLGDAELGLREFETAEMTYRTAVMQQPELWQAHKNLVVVEAALGRWEEFDRERTVLRMARQRGAPGISTRESDVIDSFSVLGGHWVVRAYFEPLGRSRARYNFERFSEDGRVQAYLSLEDAQAALAALTPNDVRIGGDAGGSTANSKATSLALNWYTGSAHGTLRSYASGEPSYETLRAEVMSWLRKHPELSGAGQGRKAGREAHLSSVK